MDHDSPLATGRSPGSAADAGRQLLFIGSWQRLAAVADRLHAAGCAVLLAPEARRMPAPPEGWKLHLVVAEVDGGEGAAGIAAIADLAQRARCPWLALDDGTMLNEALTAGAVAVLPAGAESDLIERALLSVLARASGDGEAPSGRRPGGGRRRYREGDLVLLRPGQILIVEEGILVRTALHADGTEVLLGFVTPGGLVVGPGDDLFACVLAAGSEAVVSTLPWEEALVLPRFAERLRDQLTWAEAWSAAQARPHLDDRLTGIIELLSRQFGRPHAKGMLIDLRVTHARLAQAVGATRSTVTRLLARLRRAGWLAMGDGRNDREAERWIVTRGNARQGSRP